MPISPAGGAGGGTCGEVDINTLMKVSWIDWIDTRRINRRISKSILQLRSLPAVAPPHNRRLSLFLPDRLSVPANASTIYSVSVDFLKLTVGLKVSPPGLEFSTGQQRQSHLGSFTVPNLERKPTITAEASLLVLDSHSSALVDVDTK